MIDTALALLAPHYCSDCRQIGTTLCDNSKYDIISEHLSICIACKKPASERGIRWSCHLSYDRAWMIARRQDVLETVIDLYKFEHVMAAYNRLCSMLDDVLPILPKETIVIAVPTISSHKRERGYDHCLLVARDFARRRGLTLSKVLRLASSATQRGASATVRKKQAAQAFTVPGTVQPDVPYLLVDDIVTTGATLEYTTRVLKAAGASQVWVATIAYQALD